ncbi:hypothetical protein SAMN05421805_12951 [Saccharopolyspora antimicrobica]|uniref:Uncharacterized protein n=1 Tax=Saccharopolyspora antimicrobica TaxID=455193 RepID=A0A1I5L794_9PSEU|nr:hypothetical protein [Saccharopolyspora antimicrobica]RKT86870.1 hypothetical protein ATL45_5249 [Saccharopolyspora antimicrobica]SFO93052.1 hypothetical protein SAMN05421805_12951 [Saccharopolyspora antimicrobica]
MKRERRSPAEPGGEAGDMNKTSNLALIIVVGVIAVGLLVLAVTMQ